MANFGFTNKLESLDTILSYAYIYLAGIGMGTHYYDKEKKKLTNWPRAVIYCVLVDIFFAMVTPVFLFIFMRHVKDELIFEKPVTAYLNIFMLFLNLVTVLISRVRNWSNRLHARKVFNEINQIRAQDLAFVPEDDKIPRKAIRIVKLKLLCSLIIFAGSFIILLQKKSYTSVDLLGALYFGLLFSMVLSVENQFCFGMVYGSYLFNVLNSHLSSIVKDIKDRTQNGALCIPGRKSDLLIKQLNFFGMLHTKLHRLITCVKDLFQFQLIMILISIFVTTVYVFFVFSMFSNLSFKDSDLLFVLTMASVVLTVGNLWLLVYICGEVIEACNVAADILNKLPSQHVFNKQLESEIELLALQLVREKLPLNVCGLFNLEWKTGFILTKAAIMNWLLLLQIDIQNI